MDAGFEAGEVQLEGCGAGGVGSVAGGQAGEAVAAVDADGIVGEAGGDAEVELVVVLIFGIVDGAVGTFGMTVEFALTDIMVSAVGDIGSEIPVDSLAEHSATNKAYTLEQLEAALVEDVVFLAGVVR